jgi:Uma2 family endonuclease
VAFRLARLLDDMRPDDLVVRLAPFAVLLAKDTELQPDVLVARRADFTARNLPMAPALAVEVLSPSTRLIDHNLKRARYEAAERPAYWVLDPDGLELTAWELVDGTYDNVAHVAGDDEFRAATPFPLIIRPSRLLD